MSADFKKLFSTPLIICLSFIAVLAAVVVFDFFFLDLARRTFVFYTLKDGGIVVEDRMLKHAETKEGDIIRYAEETLLGPVTPDLLPLFPKETKLISLLYREGVVYVNFTSDAAMPPLEGGVTIDNFRTFHAGILRNFSYVSDVRFFIEGTAVYTEGFRHENAKLFFWN
ncbi:MAG: GerMN domain-containing protein [Treponema sp.]|nr:GerMN domain-containing protein [Treponema sp.]